MSVSQKRSSSYLTWPLRGSNVVFYGLIKVSMAHYTACRLTSSGPPLSPPSSRSISRCCSSQRPRDTAKLFLHIFFFLGCFFCDVLIAVIKRALSAERLTVSDAFLAAFLSRLCEMEHFLKYRTSASDWWWNSNKCENNYQEKKSKLSI